MESTGFYWKQLFVMLQSYGMEVYLVNASFTKHLQGRKPSDLSDSQWMYMVFEKCTSITVEKCTTLDKLKNKFQRAKGEHRESLVMAP